MVDHFDVAVIGGGPSGATCALALRRHGVPRVAIIDRQKFPRDKACGDGLGPGVVRVAQSLDLSAVFTGYRPVEALSVTGPGGTEVSGRLPLIGGAPPIGYVIPRIEFDNRLFKSATQQGASDFSGYELHQGSFDYEKDTWTLILQSQKGANDRAEERRVTCSVLIGADGARSRVRQILGVPYNSDTHTGTAARIYATTPKTQDAALHLDFMHNLLPAYGWRFPISGERANVGVGIDVSKYKQLGCHLKNLLANYQADVGERTRFSYDSRSYLAYLLPYGSELPRLAHIGKRAVLIGDAGSMINPLTGEGIYYGMFAAKMLAELLSESLVTARTQLFEALHQFERDFRSHFEEHFKVNAWMKVRTSDPFKCDMVIRACQKDRVVLGDLINLMMGDQQSLNGSTLLRIFWSGLLSSR